METLPGSFWPCPEKRRSPSTEHVENRDEEKEHAAMLIEWVRRNMDNWDKELHDYLFTSAPLGAHEAAGTESAASASDLGIGKL